MRTAYPRDALSHRMNLYTAVDKSCIVSRAEILTTGYNRCILVEFDGVDFSRMARKSSGGCRGRDIPYKHRSITAGGSELDVVMRTKTNL